MKINLKMDSFNNIVIKILVIMPYQEFRKNKNNNIYS